MLQTLFELPCAFDKVLNPLVLVKRKKGKKENKEKVKCRVSNLPEMSMYMKRKQKWEGQVNHVTFCPLRKRSNESIQLQWWVAYKSLDRIKKNIY